ncbi:DUF58 domain-containing protein [Tepidiforma sp.]|uniref:DUF58 domain-containing protein n=1 Tax=Tepidiforma sp. TaxID=2682230 RepID=UPI0021DC32C9|nr:DUF58 domain-containing protein [Tepidiforma sp.]MCX7618679.1 DUF58 domain-containing protein [Tepidiforma sp.]GIW19341.1 MAG: hypothetical protein KatS3mg064_2498 [Tepidiforma sp.]
MSALLARRPTPDAPGPGPMPEAVLRALDITVGRRVSSLLAGDFRSHGLGTGTELAQVREYVPGDDVRRIDWNVTARTLVPHVREFVAERVLTTWLVLDASASMLFGTADRRKYDVAEGVALAAGHVATRHGNALGVYLFDGERERLMRPAQGRAGLLALLLALRLQPPAGGAAASLGRALQRVDRLAGRGRLVLIVSDFRGPRDWERPLLQVAARHDVLAVEIRDPREQELPDVGELWLMDPETGRRLRVDTGSRRLRERFAAAAAAERAEVAAAIARAGARHIVLSTSGDWLRPFAAGLLEKGYVR